MTSVKKNTNKSLRTQITPSHSYGETRFRPTHADDLDLRWYFAMGPSEKWKTEDQRRRHRRIARCLSGHGWALRYYYQNPRKLEPAELAPLVFDERVGRGSSALSGLTPDERETHLRRAVRRGGGSDWLVEGTRLLNLEYSYYIRNKARHYADVDDHIVVDRLALEGLLGIHREHWFDGELYGRRRGREILVHPGDFVDEMLMRGQLDRSTWDALRVSGTTAQLLVERVGIGPLTGQISKKRALDLLKEAADRAPPPPPRVLTMTPRERATFSYGLPEAAYKAPKFTTEDVQENRRSLTQDLREIRRDNAGLAALDYWGVADHELRSDLWDPRKLELDPLKETTTVSEIAKRAKLPNQWVRSALVKRGCPGATIKRAPIPVLWFSSEQGRDFWAAVKREKVAIDGYNWKLGKR